MSHTATLRCKVENLQALDKACATLNLELHQGQRTFKAYTNGKCEHAISVKGNKTAYEIGLAKQGKDPHYSMMFDDFSGGYGLMAIVGANCNKLVQHYAMEVAKLHIPVELGFELQQPVTLADGSLELTAVRL